ncbi:MAG: hypothetical protein GX585_04045 [Clostridiales bacterium]|nr:hypothetical protein [Clostridiales bacterium]
MRRVFSTSSLILGIVFFVLFMVAACVAYYMTAGVFVTSELAILYAVLGILGALGAVFRLFLFSGLFYAGCVLGWLTGRFVGSLEGAFAPKAGVICTFFLIGVFSLLGILLEVKRQKRRHRKRAAQREREEEAAAEAAKQALAREAARTPEAAVPTPGPAAPAAPSVSSSPPPSPPSDTTPSPPEEHT